MNPSDALLTITEIAIAIIGFAGIVFALRPPRSGAAESMHRLRLRIMIEASAYVMALAFLPLLFIPESEAGMPVWRIGTGILAVTAPILVSSIYVRQRRIFGSALLRETLLFDSSTIIVAIAVEAILVLTALGLVALRPFPVYLLGLLFPLGAAVAMFVRALFASSSTLHDPGPDHGPDVR